MTDTMKDSPLLPNFPVRFGRPRKTNSDKAKSELKTLRSAPLQDLKSLMSPWINFKPLKRKSTGENSRERVYDQATTFLAYLLQLLNGESCRAAVKRVQSWRKHAGLSIPSSATGAYCQARMRLAKGIVKRIFDQCVNKINRKLTDESLWHGRRVKVVDGTGLSMPDTKLNQKVWPQNGAMKKGCGFPQLNLVGLFCLTTGALLKYATGNKYDGELTLWKPLMAELNSGDLVLGDRAYDSFGNLASLMSCGVDCIFPLRRRRNLQWPKNTVDQIITLDKKSSRCFTEEEWEKLPDSIEVRVVKLKIEKKGHRPTDLCLVTTVKDPQITPQDLAELYLRRWDVELFFRDVKTSLGMDVLKSKKARLVEKEIQMYAILYNVVRGMMYAAEPMRSSRISFKSSVDHLRNWLWLFLRSTTGSISKMLKDFNESIRDCLIPHRPGRAEPRCRKRRPKKYKLMNKPRREMAKTSAIKGIEKWAFYPLSKCH